MTRSEFDANNRLQPASAQASWLQPSRCQRRPARRSWLARLVALFTRS